MARTYFNVRPRYTPGSPAMVSQVIAEQVMRQEREGYQHALEGIYGDEARRTAETLGLAGIVYTTTEVRNKWIEHDLLTDVVTQQRIKSDGSLVA